VPKCGNIAMRQIKRQMSERLLNISPKNQLAVSQVEDGTIVYSPKMFDAKSGVINRSKCDSCNSGNRERGQYKRHIDSVMGFQLNASSG